MKVTLVTPWNAESGIGTHARELVKYLNKSGVDTKIYTAGRSTKSNSNASYCDQINKAEVQKFYGSNPLPTMKILPSTYNPLPNFRFMEGSENRAMRLI